jgi:hypothetical protein
MNLRQSRLSEQPEQRAWIKVTFSWAAALLSGLSFFPIMLAIAALAFPGSRAIHFGYAVDKTALTVILVFEIGLMALVPLVTARLLGYCRVRFWRWGLAGFGSLLAFAGGYWFGSLGLANLSAWLTRSNIIANYLHTVPFATAGACFLVVSWLGASATLWRYRERFLLGLAVGIVLATANGIWNLYVIGGDSGATFHDFWIVPPFIWSSAVLFIERAAGRADRTAFLVWLGLTAVMFILPYFVIRFLR